MTNTRTRASEETQTRRRRNDGTTDALLDLKLSIPDEIKAAHPDCVFRWANDTTTRIHNLTVRDDWDKVPDVDPRPVGTDERGNPVMSILLKKPKAFQAEDDARKEARRREIERAQVHGLSRAREDDVPEAVRYVPGGNRIGASFAP